MFGIYKIFLSFLCNFDNFNKQSYDIFLGALDLKKGLFILLFACAGQLYAYEYSNVDCPTHASAELLVWQLRQGASENWSQEISPPDTIKSIKIRSIPFKWKTGFRIGLGHKFDYDCWDSVFTYTWYQTTGRDKAFIASGGVFSSFLGNFFATNTTGNSDFGPNYRNANIKWKLLFNTADVELGRSFIINPVLQLRPYIGMKLSSIQQRIHSFWFNPTNANTFNFATENLKYNFWGIGPTVGLCSKWCIYESVDNVFSLIANVSGSAMWGHWSFKDLYENNAPSSIAIHLSNINGAATMGRGLLGFEWKTCFTGSDLSLRLGYEAQVWFNQLQFYSLNMGRLNNLMSLQGVVLGLGFNF